MKKIVTIYVLLAVFGLSCALAQTNEPIRSWGTYYGGINEDEVLRAVTDDNGNLYIVGNTSSDNVIATAGAYQTTRGGGVDCFLAKFNSQGTRLWATYYGGSNDESVNDMKIDGNGNIIIVGGTFSTNGISTSGTFQESYGGGDTYGGDGFIAKFSSDGQLLWATYYGGLDEDWCTGVSVDNNNNIIVGGITDSDNNISTSGSFQTTRGGSYDEYLVKFNSAGTRLWSTYYGGTDYDWNARVAVDKNNNIYLYGDTQGSIGAISTSGSYQENFGGGSFDFYLVKFDENGNRQWGTYYGGPGQDANGFALTVDSKNNVIIAGKTNSTTGIATTGSYQPSFGGGNTDVFIAKFNSSGNRLWATYYGGSGDEDGAGLITNNNNDIYFLGAMTTSSNNITSSNAYQSNLNSDTDAYIVKFDSTGLRKWGTYFGGSSSEYCNGITTDKNGFFYICGMTQSNNDISTSGAFQTTIGGGSDGFIEKFSDENTGILEKYLHKTINIYPNPASDNITIENSSLNNNKEEMISIYNIEGELLIQQTMLQAKTNVDIAGLAKGMYFVEVKTEKGSTMKKFLKE